VPFSPEELLARASVITRRATGSSVPIIPTIRIGEIEVDIVGREVRTGNSEIHLSGIEHSLVYLIASRGGQVVTRDEILDTIWGTDFIAESNIVDRQSGACGSTSTTTTANRASSPRFRRAVTGSSRPSPTQAGTARPRRRTLGRTDEPAPGRGRIPQPDPTTVRRSLDPSTESIIPLPRLDRPS